MTDENALVPVEEPQALAYWEREAMRPEDLVEQVALIQRVMETVMEEGEHYGVIPGTEKPTLYKAGAEKLCVTFRVRPEYEIMKEHTDESLVYYRVKCRLIGIHSGIIVGEGVGSCNSNEDKFLWRYTETLTNRPVPEEYWKARKAGNNKEMTRLLGGPEFRPRKDETTGKWVIAQRSERVKNDNVLALDNTILKMAKKRAYVDAVITATAASDIFAQDLEDLEDTLLYNPHPHPEVDRGPAVSQQKVETHKNKSQVKVDGKSKDKVKASKQDKTPQEISPIIGQVIADADAHGKTMSLYDKPGKAAYETLISVLSQYKQDLADAGYDADEFIKAFFHDNFPEIKRGQDLTLIQWNTLYSAIELILNGEGDEEAITGETT